MGPMNDVTNAVKRNFDGKIAFSAMAGVAALGVVAFAMHRSNIKVLKQVANVATSGKK
ncbi:hypothetical protein [Teredinibacter turnerae]|uniref:Uncharacterized protein n=1 Tax=Teredinibacter turnerae (strain ATCC 39867 / T7901) TaxID=377629 RepID=C5BSN6_TERTT|nr:hypothetical protein [Teredinibacter turnerae]ACR14333.1 hypothetical protein TERTU_1434 [Teredinibacter turnerae T7901]